MVRLVTFTDSDALQDAIRSKRKCNQLDDQIDELKTLLNGSTADPAYHHCLLFLLTKTEKFKQPKRRRVCSNFVNELEDCDGESDPQYDLFLSRLKKHENSYVLEGEINGASTFIKYEGESSLRGGRRKIRRGVKRIKMVSNKNPGLPNDQDPVNQQASDMQVKLGDKSSEQSPRKLVNLVKSKILNEQVNKLAYQNTDLGTNELSQNQHSDDVQAPSNRMNNVVNLEILKNTTVIQANNGVAENQNKPRDQAQIGKKDEVQIRKNLSKSVETENMVERDRLTNSESALKKGHLHQMPSPMNNLVKGNRSKHVDHAQPREKEHSTVQGQAMKVTNAKDVIEIEYDASQIAEIIMENERTLRKTLETKYQSESVDQTVAGSSKYKVQMKCFKARRESVIQHQKPGLKMGRVTEYHCEDVDYAQALKKGAVLIQSILRIEGKNEANRKHVERVDIQHVIHRPCTCYNWVAENHCESVDQPQPISEADVESQIELKKKNMEEILVEAKNEDFQIQRRTKGTCSKHNQAKDVEDESDPEIEILDNETFFNSTGNMWNRDDSPHLKSRCLCGEFRRKLMDALKKNHLTNRSTGCIWKQSKQDPVSITIQVSEDLED